ncbi:MAG: aldehyde-activating protein [Acidimicrobiia bacterium]|nr:MAG: aldehyde-activating protein [Acidimicrobiia bacterium]
MTVIVGEGFAGEGAHVAHVNVVVGDRGGPVGAAWASALASPSPGHAPFVVVLRPNLPVRPFTLFVNKATVDGGRHATLTWGAAQAGVAAGVRDALRDGLVDADALVIAAVWVDPDAVDDRAVYEHNHAATFAALRAAREDRPRPEDVLAAGEPRNPYFPA